MLQIIMSYITSQPCSQWVSLAVGIQVARQLECQSVAVTGTAVTMSLTIGCVSHCDCSQPEPYSCAPWVRKLAVQSWCYPQTQKRAERQAPALHSMWMLVVALVWRLAAGLGPSGKRFRGTRHEEVCRVGAARDVHDTILVFGQVEPTHLMMTDVALLQLPLGWRLLCAAGRVCRKGRAIAPWARAPPPTVNSSSRRRAYEHWHSGVSSWVNLRDSKAKRWNAPASSGCSRSRMSDTASSETSVSRRVGRAESHTCSADAEVREGAVKVGKRKIGVAKKAVTELIRLPAWALCFEGYEKPAEKSEAQVFYFLWDVFYFLGYIV